MTYLVVVVFALQISLAIACAVALQGIGPIFGREEKQLGCFLVFQSGSMPRLVTHWFTNIFFNLLIFYSMMRKSLSIRVLKDPGIRSLSGIVLRDGALLFIVMLTVNVINLSMLLVFPYWNAINWSFSHIADVIMTSRLLFNIRAELDASSSMGDDAPNLPLQIAEDSVGLPKTLSRPSDNKQRGRSANFVRQVLRKGEVALMFMTRRTSSVSRSHAPQQHVDNSDPEAQKEKL